MSDNKPNNEEAVEEFDGELPEGPGDAEFDPDEVGGDDDTTDSKTEDGDGEDDGEEDLLPVCAVPRPDGIASTMISFPYQVVLSFN